jgi:hypothetical protein
MGKTTNGKLHWRALAGRRWDEGDGRHVPTTLWGREVDLLTILWVPTTLWGREVDLLTIR